jgi:putative heme-binding domain-containing protein
MNRNALRQSTIVVVLLAGSLRLLLPALAQGPERPRKAIDYDPKLVARLVTEAKTNGDAARGAEVFRTPQFACLTCHKIGSQGGIVGPNLTLLSRCLPPEKIIESVLWPKREVADGYLALSVATEDGKLIQGYKDREDARELVLHDPTTGNRIRIAKKDIVERTETGSLMPDGLAEAMTPVQRRDLLRFLMELGRDGQQPGEMLLAQAHAPASFPFDRFPLRPERWPNHTHPVNRDRLYDFYEKEAAYFCTHALDRRLLPEYPGLDGGSFGHWGNQNEQTWADARWNKTDLGTVLCGVFHGADVVVPKAVCVRLGEHGELSACFNPETLSYEALWRGGFLRFSPVRHGFMDGLLINGTPLPRPKGAKPDQPFVYHGFYRYEKRVIFSYRIGDVEMLDAPWVEGGKFTRLVAPANTHPLASLTRGGTAQWPQTFDKRGELGRGGPYVLDSIPLPFENPWHALLFCTGHDFLPDGSAFVSTMGGDVWRADGLDHDLKHVRWRRFASGLHQPLGLVVSDGRVYVLGRDQITCLHDLNGDGEADFYECISNAYHTSTAGHDFICGLERDSAGKFYTASGSQGLLRISKDGERVDVLATGFRNPDGLCLAPEGTITVPCSEGDWTPASMICEVQPSGGPTWEPRIGGHHPPCFGYGGPKGKQAPDLPLVYLPRGLDNSSGGQVAIASERWGPLKRQMIHLSYGACSYFLLLRDTVDCQPQGAVVPLPGDFRSGVHRGRFNPHDGQLYVTGMGGWGTYNVDDGCFQRIRYTGELVQLPHAWQAYENGVRITFTRPLHRALAENATNQFAQAWNYRYRSAYGSPEFSPSHPTTAGHDRLRIAGAHVLSDGCSLFLEIPDLQPVNQLHLHLRVDAGPAIDVFATVHRLAHPFTGFPGYTPIAKTIAAHPILADLALAEKRVPNPFRHSISGARLVELAAGQNLSFTTRTFRVRAGEPIRLVFSNPDVVPHNWVLVKPGALQSVGTLSNQLIADPDAVARQYVPRSPQVLAYTDIVQPGGRFAIVFRAPLEKGRYPYLCTFPGHWMVMNGMMIVE